MSGATDIKFFYARTKSHNGLACESDTRFRSRMRELGPLCSPRPYKHIRWRSRPRFVAPRCCGDIEIPAREPLKGQRERLEPKRTFVPQAGAKRAMVHVDGYLMAGICGAVRVDAFVQPATRRPACGDENPWTGASRPVHADGCAPSRTRRRGLGEPDGADETREKSLAKSRAS